MRTNERIKFSPKYLIAQALFIFLVFLDSNAAAAQILSSEQQPHLQASQICDSIPDRLSDADIETLKEKIILFAPVRYANMARKIQFENDDSTGGFGPYSTPADEKSPPTIHIPTQFRLIQCRLTAATFLYSAMRELPSATSWSDFSVGEFMKRCDPLRVGMVECLTRLSSALSPQAKGGLTEDLMDILESVSEDAFLHIILHEFAHLALNHQRSGEQQEYAADTFATLRIALSRQNTLGAFASYSGLSAADPYVKGPHGSFACRANIVRSVNIKLKPLASAGSTWATEPRSDYLAHRAQQTGRKLDFTIIGNANACSTDGQSFIEPLRWELQTLVEILDAEGINPASTFSHQVSRLLDFQPLTEEGKIFKMSIVSERIWRSSVEDDSVGSIRVQLPLIDRVLGQGDISYMRSSDYGRLTSMAAIMAYDLAKDKRVLVEMDAALRRGLERAILYHPRFSVARLHLGLLYYRQGNCAAGRDQLLKAAEISGSDMDTDRTVSTILSGETRDGCARASARMKEQWRSMRGWQ